MKHPKVITLIGGYDSATFLENSLAPLEYVIEPVTDVDQVSVKATTTDKMGFEGRQEGVSAQAVCLLDK